MMSFILENNLFFNFLYELLLYVRNGNMKWDLIYVLFVM